MGDFSMDNLTPEEKAIFDAMVEEEMRKLETQIQQEANALEEEEQQPILQSPTYIPTQRPPPSVHDFGSFNEGPSRQSRPDNNSLNPRRLEYKSPEWNNEDEVVVGRRGIGMNVGRHQTNEEKRLKQREYAAQLNDGIQARNVTT